MTDSQPRAPFYLITPPLSDAASFLPLLDAALSEVDVSCVLLDLDARDAADAKKILQNLIPLVQRRGAAALVRDPALAARAGADGAHIIAKGEGFADALQQAVSSLKPERIVGVGCLETRHDAMMAGEQGADYVMFGDCAREVSQDGVSVHDLVGWWSEIFTPPCVACCNDLADAPGLLAAGADFIALGQALWSDPRGPVAALKDLLPLTTSNRSRSR